MRHADPEFYPLVEKMRAIQQSGEIGLRVTKTGDQTATLIVFGKTSNSDLQSERAEVRKLLGLNPEVSEFNVVYGSVAANDREIALLTRSVIEILNDLASYIDVPAADVEQKRTYQSPAPEMANGVPVVQPRHGAFPEVLELTRGGMLCEPDDPASLGAGIEDLLLDREAARAMGERGRQVVFQRFSVERMVRETLQGVEEIAGRSSDTLARVG